jgi:hypothetical protein
MAEPPPSNLGIVVAPRFFVSVEYIDELLKSVYRRAYARVIFLVGTLMFLLCLCSSLSSSRDWRSGLPVMVAVLITVPVTAILNFKRAFRRANALILKMDHRRIEFTFDDYGVLQVSALGTSRLMWSMFTKIVRRRDVWLLHLGGRRGAHIFPVVLMPPDLQDFIVRKCSDNGVKIR